jgi:hypothetical protein
VSRVLIATATMPGTRGFKPSAMEAEDMEEVMEAVTQYRQARLQGDVEADPQIDVGHLNWQSAEVPELKNAGAENLIWRIFRRTSAVKIDSSPEKALVHVVALLATWARHRRRLCSGVCLLNYSQLSLLF